VESPEGVTHAPLPSWDVAMETTLLVLPVAPARVVPTRTTEVADAASAMTTATA
jgi:hypothetical protein